MRVDREAVDWYIRVDPALLRDIFFVQNRLRNGTPSMGENLIKRLIEFLQGSRIENGQRQLSWFARTKFGAGFIEVLRELESVTWPTKEDVRGSTVVVLITVAVFALYAGFWDLVMTYVDQWLY